MIDPVDADALRARADENADWAQVAFGLPNREQDARELLLNADTFRAAADEVDRLRAVIENAPHQNSCRTYDPTARKCTCWKADAL